MKVNLKELFRQKEELKYVQSILRNEKVTSGLAKKLDKTINLLDEIEIDLGLSGESIIEIDMPRLEAIEERDKFASFYNKADEL